MWCYFLNSPHPLLPLLCLQMSSICGQKFWLVDILAIFKCTVQKCQIYWHWCAINLLYIFILQNETLCPLNNDSLLLPPLQLPSTLMIMVTELKGSSDGSDSKESTCNAGDMDSIPGSWRYPWRRKQQHHSSIFYLSEKFHGQWSLVGYSLWSCKELDMTEWLTHYNNT